MAHDPIGDVALGPMRDLLQRYLQVVDVLASAIDALNQQLEPLSEMPEPFRPTHEPSPAVMSVENKQELQNALAFQERLSGVIGVATVTLEGSSSSGFRFLVEMDNPPH